MAEFVIPGGVVAPMGIGAIVAVLLHVFGIVTGPMNLFMSWIGSTLGLVIVFRLICVRLFQGESICAEPDEKLEVFGKVVEVLETIRPGDATGRISYQGTTWTATSTCLIEKGQKARLIASENLTWVVEPLPNAELEDLQRKEIPGSPTGDR